MFGVGGSISFYSYNGLKVIGTEVTFVAADSASWRAPLQTHPMSSREEQNGYVFFSI